MVGYPLPFVPIALLVPEIKIGSIGLWWGSVINIPPYWALCDGSHGTPDLMDKMILAAGGSFGPGGTGGSVHHDHDFTSLDHSHYLWWRDLLDSNNAASSSITNVPITGTSDHFQSLPPFYSLAYLMYIGE